jgi:hypothetical protein
VNSLHDVEARPVSAIIWREIGAPEGRIVSVPKGDRRLAFQPWIAPMADVPKMLMGIDDR